MKKLIPILLAVLVVSVIAATGVIAQENPNASAKATAECGDINIVETSSWDTILVNTIKTPNQKDLFIDVSLESGLYTRTLVKSKRNYEGDPDWDTSTAHAKIEVRVVIDEGTDNERIAFPGSVIFNEREQTLSAKFMGIFTGDCLIVTEDEYGNHTVTIDYGCLEPEELELILNTMSANSFNFLLDDLTPGVHTISVQASIVTNGSAEEGEFEATAIIGLGSMTVEEVRFIQDENIVMP